MHIKELDVDKYILVQNMHIEDLRPGQEKAIKAGLLKGNNILVCTPTASGKTFIGELAAMQSILTSQGKAVYIAPLRALAREKHVELSSKYPTVKFALSIGDEKSSELAKHDFIMTTSEKLDSLVRHHAAWLRDVKVVIVDEIHLLNDPSRGPALEILITLLRKLLRPLQIVALSATIGNPEELASWLDAKLIVDDWRPVELKKGIYKEGKINFSDPSKPQSR